MSDLNEVNEADFLADDRTAEASKGLTVRVAIRGIKIQSRTGSLFSTDPPHHTSKIKTIKVHKDKGPCVPYTRQAMLISLC